MTPRLTEAAERNREMVEAVDIVIRYWVSEGCGFTAEDLGAYFGLDVSDLHNWSVIDGRVRAAALRGDIVWADPPGELT